MSSTAQSDRINALLARADESIAAGDLHKASEALREASHLDPQNAHLKDRWTKLQSQEGGGNALELLRTYIASSKDDDGRKAIEAIKQNALSADDAIEVMELLLIPRNDSVLLDILTGVFLSQNVAARTFTTKKICGNATEIFEVMFKRGDKSFNAFASIPLDNSLWPSKELQTIPQKDLFQLCVATLIDAGAEHLERAMKCIARLLSAVPDAVVPLVDDDVFDAILSCLDIRLEAPLRSQTMLATSKLLEATKETGHDLFSKFITERAAKQTNDDFIIVFSAAAAVFPLIPVVAAKLFLVDGFVQQLVPNLEKNWDDGAAGKRKSHTLETAALELLSAACVDKACRDAIKRYCSHWLQNLTEEREGTHKALAALVLAKISAGYVDNITAKLEAMILSDDAEMDQAIEGLAYTSLQPSIKEEIANNEKLMSKIIGALGGRGTVMFGCLTVLNNLTASTPPMSEEEKKLSQLKAYANSSTPAPEDPLDDTAHINVRCRKVLDAGAVPALVGCCKQSTSLPNVHLVVGILLALAQDQKHRPRMAQHGAVKVLLQVRDRIAGADKTLPAASGTGRTASHALARILISVNPSHIFSGTLPASSAVSALVPLLSDDETSETRNLLPTFEALLALTNLTSMEDNSVRDQVLRLAWSQLEDRLLFSSNQMVQRASMELVCNLVASPSGVAKFVGDGSKREKTRMQIILALADAEDFATRRAAGGALAMLTEWDAAVGALLDQKSASGPNGIKVLLKLCTDTSDTPNQNDELRHRGIVCVGNVVNAPGDIGARGIERVKEENGVKALQEVMELTKNPDIMAATLEVLKKVIDRDAFGKLTWINSPD